MHVFGLVHKCISRVAVRVFHNTSPLNSGEKGLRSASEACLTACLTARRMGCFIHDMLHEQNHIFHGIEACMYSRWFHPI